MCKNPGTSYKDQIHESLVQEEEEKPKATYNILRKITEENVSESKVSDAYQCTRGTQNTKRKRNSLHRITFKHEMYKTNKGF